MNIDPQSLMNKATDLLLVWGPKLLLALVVLVIGFWLSNKVANLIKHIIKKQDIDPAVGSFLSSLIRMGLKALVVISAASMVGIATTSFVAILGALGLAVGMALQGSLSNFAGGVMILVFKPFKIGDYIESPDAQGTVTDIHIFHTTLLSLDNKKVILPNGPLSNGKIVNYSSEATRRVEFSFGISYEDDIQKATDVMTQTVTSSQFAIQDPAPTVAVTEHGESSVNFTVHAWCKNEDYWNLYFDLPGKMKVALDNAGIGIPFPQMDIHMKQGQ